MCRNRFLRQSIFLLTTLSLHTETLSDPTPIVRDEDEVWTIDPTASFASSGLTLEIRRFAFIPDPAPIDSPGNRARPNTLTFAPGDSRLFLADAGLWISEDPPATGVIYAISPDGSSVTEILNVGAALHDRFGDDGDMVHVLSRQGGLRSVAFHPDFDKAGSAGFGKLYTTQLQGRPESLGGVTYLGPSNPTGDNEGYADGVLAEWTAVLDSGGRIDGVDLDSYREVFRVAIPDLQHPIKQAAFNPLAQPGDEDYGLLYVLHGDGVESRTAGTGQQGDTALGKVIRIDPLQNGSESYGVPTSNPFLDQESILNEVFTLGHRNPHTIAFAKDADCSMRILISEIGHGSVEEINLLRAGGNYGWGQREGTFVRIDFTSVSDLPADDALNDFVYPVAQYGHNPRNVPHAIVGGYVVANDSQLGGYYFFGDFTSGDRPLMTFALSNVGEAVLTGDPDALAPTDILTVDVVFDDDSNPSTAPIPKSSFLDIVNDEPTHNGSGRTDLRFGQGPGGELYLLNKSNGWVYQVVNSVSDEARRFDLDDDGTVSLEDFATLLDCVQGPGHDVPEICKQCGVNRLDTDHDGDLDMKDFRKFLTAFSGD